MSKEVGGNAMKEPVRKIKIKTDHYSKRKPDVSIGGWFQGKATYLWIGDHNAQHCLGVISGHKLYRLAKAIVKHYERPGSEKLISS